MSRTIQVNVTRGDIVESLHRVEAIVVDVNGAVVAQTDGADLVTYWRSSAKPFQALPLMKEALSRGIELSDGEKAIMCASHAAEPRHVEYVAKLLHRFGLDEGVLQCGAHPPMHVETATDMVRKGESPRPIHCNCSGKHAGMLSLAQLIGAPTETYLQPDNLVQKRIMTAISAMTGTPEKDLIVSVDGCGAPVVALKLYGMALAYARLGYAADNAADNAQEVSPAGEWTESAGELARAMQAQPFFVSGTDRICTRLMEVFEAEVVAKGGAEGVYCVGLPKLKLGIALKVIDGAARATAPAITAILRALNVGDADDYDRLAAFVRPTVENNAGRVVGHMTAHLSKEFPFQMS